MEELKKKLHRELEDLSKQGKMSSAIVDMVQKLTSAIKNIDTIEAMEEGYSNRGSYDYDGSYARDRRGRNSDGSYRIRRDGGRDQRYSYEDGYSRELKHELRDMMMDASPHERKMIEKWIEEIDV